MDWGEACPVVEELEVEVVVELELEVEVEVEVWLVFVLWLEEDVVLDPEGPLK